MSLQYRVSHSSRLSDEEAATLKAVLGAYNRDHSTYTDLTFDTDPMAVAGISPWALEGASKLPEAEALAWEQLQASCHVMSRCRRLLPDASWKLNVNDRTIPWDETAQAFVPSR